MHWRSDSVRLCPREISAAKRLQIKISCGQERPEVDTPPPRSIRLRPAAGRLVRVSPPSFQESGVTSQQGGGNDGQEAGEMIP